MKFYFSARYSRLPELQAYAQELEALGHVVTSRWISDENENFDLELLDPSNRNRATAHLSNSLGDLTTADAVICFTEQPRTATLGGRHVELGVAIAMDKRVFIIGPTENIFYILAEDSQFDSFDRFVRWLKIHTSRYGPNEDAVRTVIDFASSMSVQEINGLYQTQLGSAQFGGAQLLLSDIEDEYSENIWFDAISTFRKNANGWGIYGDAALKGALYIASAALAEAYREMLSDDDYQTYTATYRHFAELREETLERQEQC